MRRLTIGILMLATGISGCSVWPEYGRGGMAEQYAYMGVPVMPDQPMGPEHGLRFEYVLVKQQLDVLILEGAALCFPAAVVQAQERQHRIIRQLTGGLDFDAANDLIIQRKQLQRLEKQLDYVQQHRVCEVSSAEQQQADSDQQQVRRVYELLNSDNQFATDSAHINPKYMGRLAEAAQLLKDQANYHLNITGHADARGSSERNRELAMARAQQVQRYLSIFGITEKRIHTDAVGADDPLFHGNESHVLLTNRRVSIEVIDVSQTPASAME
ncbi:hypothetical protein CHH28_13725 [Bacterioplanes sanyensis]|uniref:OmpA-like domain-containing protein n=1 Tax=Bacterioplanes sanyensis TaxID=1249553 RepID=A0A222FKV4_9GAMM|nr:OmpA family protein [Bacterioplanes sanyensis]ASP39665.1 hypothetical protein CHH28_13725 [Bacterioplanes sanyensis]